MRLALLLPMYEHREETVIIAHSFTS